MPQIDKANVCMHKKRFTIISSEIIENPELSLRAKGILCFFLGKPDKWRLRICDMQFCLKESRSAIYAALRELRDFGLLALEEVRDRQGHFAYYVYHVSDGIEDISGIEDNFDNAVEQKEISENTEPIDLPYTDNPHTDLPHAENQEAAINIEYNNNIINNNKKEGGGEPARAETSPETESESDSDSAEEEKMLYKEKMEFEPGVFLSINEFDKLEKLYGELGVLDVIERYSLYKKTKNKSYSDDFLTLYRWFERDLKEKQKLLA